VASSAIRSGLAAACCGLGAWYTAGHVDWTGGGRSVGSFALLLGAVGVGVTIYLVACKILRIRELDDVLKAFLRRGAKKR